MSTANFSAVFFFFFFLFFLQPVRKRRPRDHYTWTFTYILKCRYKMVSTLATSAPRSHGHLYSGPRA